MAGRAAFALCLLALLGDAFAGVGRQLLQPIDPVYPLTASPSIWSGKPSSTYVWGSNSTNLGTPSGVNPTNGLPVMANPLNKAWRAGDTFVSYAPGFSSGVASGDPLPGQIILWTRFQVPGDQSAMAAADPTNTAFTFNYAPAAGTLPVNVSWWVNNVSSATATPLEAAGTYTTDGSRDWTVKLDVNYGSVAAGATMYYGFSATYNGVLYTSPMGKFRAIDTGNTLSTVNYAVASCSNWGFGAFNAYDMIAKIDNLDFYMHGAGSKCRAL